MVIYYFCNLKFNYEKSIVTEPKVYIMENKIMAARKCFILLKTKISKKNNSKSWEEFWPISLVNEDVKIFCSIFAKRMINFVWNNNYVE